MSTPLCLEAMSKPVTAPVASRRSKQNKNEISRLKRDGFDAECSCAGEFLIVGAGEPIIAFHKSTGATSQNRVNTVSDVMRPPWAMREGSSAHSVHATNAAMTDAAKDDMQRLGDIDKNAKYAITPVANTMAPLQTCKDAPVSRGNARSIVFTHRDAAAPVMKNAAKIVAAFMEELEPKGPAIAVAPCLLLEGWDVVLGSRPPQDDAPAGN